MILWPSQALQRCLCYRVVVVVAQRCPSPPFERVDRAFGRYVDVCTWVWLVCVDGADEHLQVAVFKNTPRPFWQIAIAN